MLQFAYQGALITINQALKIVVQINIFVEIGTTTLTYIRFANTPGINPSIIINIAASSI